jgi:hypothetical protein
MDNLALEQILLRVLRFFPCQYRSTMFQPHFHLHVALTISTSGGRPGTFQQAMLFPNWGGGAPDSKVLSIYLNPQNFLNSPNLNGVGANVTRRLVKGLPNHCRHK